MSSVNNPDHYNDYSVEVIEMMIRIWGKKKMSEFCEINAFKYRMRMGLKGEQLKDDIRKERWYLNKSKELKESM